jgi:hypothetical protein
MKKTLLLAAFGLLSVDCCPLWGFFAHEKINRLAIFTLPPAMIGFFKENVDYLSQAAVNPDKRRYVVEEEGARHYIDLDHYGDSALQVLPHEWHDAIKEFGNDSLQAYGILPWHIEKMFYRLRDAFLKKDPALILKVSAELGHYIADANVPLHTTQNYNGQLTGQEGIHGFWESRLPETFFNEYDFFVGRASYLENPRAAAWEAIRSAHLLVDRVLAEEKKLSDRYQERKYGFETRGKSTVKVYAMEYTREYHSVLDGMVEKQMRASVKMIGDFWFTAWLDAGQPDLTKLIHAKPSHEELLENRKALDEMKERRFSERLHE